MYRQLKIIFLLTSFLSITNNIWGANYPTNILASERVQYQPEHLDNIFSYCQVVSDGEISELFECFSNFSPIEYERYALTIDESTGQPDPNGETEDISMGDETGR